jgi:hypothetical protein
MKKTAIAATLLLVGLAPCCLTTGGPDWPAISAEVGNFRGDLADAEAVVENPELREKLERLDEALALVQQAASGAEGVDRRTALQAALDVSGELLKRDDLSDAAKAVLIVGRGALRRALTQTQGGSDGEEVQG